MSERYERWHILPLPGLVPDSLGNYLASLGLLTSVSKRWPNVRACWQGDKFVLVNGPAHLEALVAALNETAEGRLWAGYNKAWGLTQQRDTKGKTAASTGLWRSYVSAEEDIPLFQAHLSFGERLSFNPLLGTGGNAGRRDFSVGWAQAVNALASPNSKWTRTRLTEDISSFLAGGSCSCLGDFSAASWFSSANKAFNSGTRAPFRNGQLTPWAMVLACEAIPLFKGATSRQLGTARKATGAFPFVTSPASPENAGDAGRNVAELWVPVWNRPMSTVEVSSLFDRGRAELRGRAATSASGFSVAVIARGIDSGIAHFRRFILLRTTSENTFESRLEAVVPVSRMANNALAAAAEVALRLRDALPPDRKKGKRWIYAGLRGPLDRALIGLASESNPENARSLVDAMFASLLSVDRNRSYRERGVRFRLLPGAWAKSLIDEQGEVSPEIRLAFAIALLRPTFTPPPNLPREVTAPLLAYLLGAQNLGRQWSINKPIPLRRVWSGGLARSLAAILQRRLIEESPNAPPPFQGWFCVALSEIELMIDGSLDDDELSKWVFRFSLFSFDRVSAAQLRLRLTRNRHATELSSSGALFSLFKPLFNSSPTQSEALGASKETAVGGLSPIVALLARGDVDAAIGAARRIYHSVGIELAQTQCKFGVCNPTRLLAALLVPVQGAELTRSFQRWRSPTRLYE